MMKIHYPLVLLGLLLLVPAQPLSAHAQVERQAEWFQATTRLFIADNENHDIVVLDLPTNEVVTRLSVPPKVMSLGSTGSGEHILATRGRDTDRPYVTVIETGLVPGEAAMRRPVVASTLLLGESMSGPRGDHVQRLHDRYMLVSEAAGRILLWPEAMLTATAAFDPEVIQIAPPDHYHFSELDDGHFLVGMTRNGQVRLFTAAGEHEKTFACERAHGVIRLGTRSFFGCHDGILVFDDAEPLTRVANPGRIRAASFHHGNGSLFSGTENADAVIRLDIDTLEAEELTFKDRVERVRTTPDGRLLLALLANGQLHIHDGATGKHRHMLELSGPMPHVQRSIGGANAPNIALHGEQAFVTLPHAGEVVVVDLGAEPAITQRWSIGGMPTRIVVVGRE